MAHEFLRGIFHPDDPTLLRPVGQGTGFEGSVRCRRRWSHPPPLVVAVGRAVSSAGGYLETYYLDLDAIWD